MDLTGGFVFAAVMAVGALVTRAVAKARGQARTAFARELGFHYVSGGPLDPERLIGTYEGVRVEVEYLVRSHSGPGTVLSTRVIASGAHPELELSGEDIVDRLVHTFTPDVRTGDTEFDEAVVVRGPPDAIVSLFDPVVRAWVRAFVTGGHRVTGGNAVAEVPGHLLARPALEPLLQQTVGVATRLRQDALSPEAIARIAIEDLNPDVRRNALTHLQRGDEALARSTHLRAGDDPDPAVRICALVYLRDYAAIEALPSADLADWGASAPQEVPYVLRHFTREPVLVSLLGYKALHAAACARLAAIGGVAALAVLREYATGAGGAARDAMDAIHARLGHTSGSLSISTTEGGELSEANDTGRLSEKKP